jgi:hypothetical protein
MTYFEKRLGQLLAFDIIRLGKIIEMMQFAFVFTILALLGASVMNRYVLFSRTEEKETFMNLFWKVGLELGLSTILFFYLRKVALLWPSLAAMVLPNFAPYTTIDVGTWIVMAVVYLWGMPKMKSKVLALFEYIIV